MPPSDASSAIPATTFDTLYKSGWLSRSHLFTNAFLSSTRSPLSPNDPRGITKQLIPGHFQAKRQTKLHDEEVKVSLPFDPAKFSFDKAGKGEIIAEVGAKLDTRFSDGGELLQPRSPLIRSDELNASGEQRHAVMINLSPVIPFHGLLVPRINAKLPQRLDQEALVRLPIEVLCLLSERKDARMLYNSLGVGWQRST